MSGGPLALRPGDRVGEYRVLGVAPGKQYRGAHVATGDRVILDVRATEDWRLVGVQFLRAQTALAEAAHPGIAKIVAHGVLAAAPRSANANRPWVASELARGTALADELHVRNTLPVDTCIRLVRACACVLAHAHAHDIVHGNLRPHHIIIARPDEDAFPVSIGDWTSQRAPGIPTFCDPPAPNVFVAPEHLRGPIDASADIYTLGAIAYRAVCGVFHDVDRDRLGEACGATEASLQFGAMVRDMLASRPTHRPTAAEVIDGCDAIAAAAA